MLFKHRPNSIIIYRSISTVKIKAVEKQRQWLWEKWDRLSSAKKQWHSLEFMSNSACPIWSFGPLMPLQTTLVQCRCCIQRAWHRHQPATDHIQWH